MVFHEISGSVADVEIDAFGAKSFHFKVNCPRHDISRGQLHPLVKPRHKSVAVRQQ